MGLCGGNRRDFLIGCPHAAAALEHCGVQNVKWILPHLAVRAALSAFWWTCEVVQPIACTPLWPASWLPAVDKSRNSRSADVLSEGLGDL